MDKMTDSEWIEEYAKTMRGSTGLDDETSRQLARDAAKDPDQRECDPVEAAREELSYWEAE